jgi:uncharacterized repeat protein (TIGR02543 family)
VNGVATDGAPIYTVTTNPEGRQVVIDGTSYTAPQTFSWTVGSSHTLSVSSPQSGTTGTQYVYASWSDGGAQTHTITLPSSSTTYTANFTTQYTLTTSVGSSGGGTVSPSGTNWYNSGQSVQITATADPGYSFSNWSGNLSGSTNPTSITMNGPKSVVANFTQNQYTLTINISPANSGSVLKNPNKSTYVYGEQVSLTATANAGYAFSNWSGGASGSSNPITITIDGSKTVTASFTAETISTPSVPTGPAGGVTGVSYTYSTGGSSSNIGHPVEYQFDWKGDGTDVSSWGAATQSKIWTAAGTFSVRARARCSICTTVLSSWSGSVPVIISPAPVLCTVTTNPAGRQMTVDGNNYTAPQTFTWTPSTGHSLSVSSPQNAASDTRYVYSSWSDGGAQTHTVTVPSSSTTYTANFTTQYTLTSSVGSSGGGTVSPSGTNWYNSSQSVTVTATANAGYSFSNWSGDLSGSTTPVSVTMNGPKNVVANFTQNQYTLTVNINLSGSGSVSKSPDKPTYVYGDQVTLTATANLGYTFSSWSGSVTGTTNPVTLTINGNKTVTANFAAVPETVLTPTVPTGPTSGMTNTSYDYSTGGSTSNLNHPVEYQFDWKGDGTVLSGWGLASQSKAWSAAGTYNVRARARCTTHTSVVSSWSGPTPVTISLAPVSCTVTTNPSGLEITVDGNKLTAPQAFTWTPGSSHSISVTTPQNEIAGTRYAYSSWSDGGAQTHTITVPSSNTTYTANFTTQYTLTSSVGSSGGGTVSPSGTNWYNSSQSVTVTATANAGYSFSGWSGDLSGTTNPTSVKMNGPRIVTANFTQNQYTLTVNVSPSGAGSVTVDLDKPTYVYGEKVTLTATANAGYNFSSWSGSVTGTTNPVTITINGDKTVTANFGAIPGTLFVNPSDGLSASGKQGGPFSPSSRNYTLQNTGGTPINWSGSKGRSWVSLTFISGTLAPGASTTITVSINGDSDSLAVGSYSDTVSFANATNGRGNSSRIVNLTVTPATQTYTVATDPPNLQVEVDGVNYTAPQTFSWFVGSSHDVKVPSPQNGSSDVRYTFASWSDGGSNTHKIIAPSSSTAFTVNFTTQYKVTTSVNPPGAGEVSSSSGIFWNDSGQGLSISANAASGYRFNGWSEDLLGRSNPAIVSTDKPKKVTANFIPLPEEIFPPKTPTGPSSGNTGTSYVFSASGASSNLGHTLEYQFDWKGDGTTDLSPWGSPSQSKIWTIAGDYNVRARARCVTHPNVVSWWSQVQSVSVAEKPFLHVLTPNGGESYLVGSTHTISWSSGYLSPNGTVYLFYWYDEAWHPIAEVSSTDISYPWTVPKSPPSLPSIAPKSAATSTSVWIGYWVNNGWECWDTSDKSFVILYDAWVFKISEIEKGGATIWFEEDTFEGYGLSFELGIFRIAGSYSIDAKGILSGTYTFLDFNDKATVLGKGSFTGGVDRSDVKTLTLQLKTLDGNPVFSMTGGRLLREPVIPLNWTAEITGSLNGELDPLKIEPYQMGNELYSHIFMISGPGWMPGYGSIDLEGYFFLTLDNIAYGTYEIKGQLSDTGVFSGGLNTILGKFDFRALSDNGSQYTFTGYKVDTPQ